MSVLEIVILLPILAALAVWLGAPARAASLGATLVNLVIVFITMLCNTPPKAAPDSPSPTCA
jgi:hypothetical protein